MPEAHDRRWMTAVAADLLAHRGRSLLIAGRGQSPAVHAMVALINEALGNTGATVRYAAQPDAMESDPAGLAALTADMKAGTVASSTTPFSAVDVGFDTVIATDNASSNTTPIFCSTFQARLPANAQPVVSTPSATMASGESLSGTMRR